MVGSGHHLLLQPFLLIKLNFQAAPEAESFIFKISVLERILSNDK